MHEFASAATNVVVVGCLPSVSSSKSTYSGKIRRFMVLSGLEGFQQVDSYDVVCVRVGQQIMKRRGPFLLSSFYMVKIREAPPTRGQPVLNSPSSKPFSGYDAYTACRFSAKRNQVITGLLFLGGRPKLFGCLLTSLSTNRCLSPTRICLNELSMVVMVA